MKTKTISELIKIAEEGRVHRADSIVDSELSILKAAKELGYVYNPDYEYSGQDQSNVLIDGIIFKNKQDVFLRVTRIFRSTKYEIDNEKTRFCLGCDDADEVVKFLKNYINFKK